MIYDVTLRRVLAATVAEEEQRELHSCVHTFVALSIHHAMRMRHTVIFGLPSSLQLFPPVSHKRHG
jgi:hypothetical protein